MKKHNKNYYFFKFYKGFVVKTDNKFAEGCIGVGILLLCATPFLHALLLLLGK